MAATDSKGQLTAELARALFSYDERTGFLTWMTQRSNAIAKGSLAGTVKPRSGYVIVAVSHHEYHVHRVIWLYVHGRWPTSQIDHINGDRSDNRLCNLREVTGAINQQNRRSPSKNNAAGFLGVHYCKQTSKWKASITVPGTTPQRIQTIGRFDTPEAASAAYLARKRVLHPGFVG